MEEQNEPEFYAAVMADFTRRNYEPYCISDEFLAAGQGRLVERSALLPLGVLRSKAASDEIPMGYLIRLKGMPSQSFFQAVNRHGRFFEIETEYRKVWNRSWETRCVLVEETGDLPEYYSGVPDKNRSQPLGAIKFYPIAQNYEKGLGG